MLVLDEKWRRPAAPHLGTGRHAHAARTLAGRITQIELQRHGAGAIARDRTPNFETRIDPKRGAWPTLPTCASPPSAPSCGSARWVRDARPSLRGAGAAARRAGRPTRSTLANRSLRCAARSTPRSTRPRRIGRRRLRRRRRRRGAADGDGASRRASAPGVGAGRAAAVGAADAIASEPAARARLEVVLDAVARRVAHPKTGEECFAAAETDVGAAAEAPGPAAEASAAEAPIAEAPAEADAEAEAEEVGTPRSPWAARPASA